MRQPSPPTPRILVVEDDADNREAIQLLLNVAGYDVTAVSSLNEALAHVDVSTFSLILTDMFAQRPANALPSVQFLQQRAHPTPVGLVSSWVLSNEAVERAGFAFYALKPFDIDELLIRVAAAVDMALTPDQARQVAVVHRYFAMLNARDWDGLVDLCVDTVIYVLPGNTPFSATITGKAAFRAYTEATFRHFPAAHFDNVEVYASPTGLATRYRGSWRAPDGSEPLLTGAVHFQFVGDRISQVGVRLNDERFQALLAPSGEQP